MQVLERTADQKTNTKIPAPLTKRAMAINIMKANADLPMEEVVDLIARANQDTPNQARAYYRWLVDNDMAPGKIVQHVRAPRNAAPAAPVSNPDKKIYRSRRTRNPRLTAIIDKKLQQKSA